MLEGFLKGLKRPEYIHVLINPLPVYGLAMGLIVLILGLMLWSREARSCGFALILIASTSAWPTLHYGQQGYDRVKAMADSEGQMARGAHPPRRASHLWLLRLGHACAGINRHDLRREVLAGRMPISLHSLVFMLVVDVGVVRMGVEQPLVLVAMSMRFAGRVVRSMFVRVMRVMNVRVVVFQCLMNMRVFVPFSGVEPDSH